MRAVATFVLTGVSALTDLDVKINGQALAPEKLEGNHLICPLPGDKLKVGENIFSFTLKETLSKPVILQDLYVRSGSKEE